MVKMIKHPYPTPNLVLNVKHVYQVDDVQYRPKEIYLHIINPSINYPFDKNLNNNRIMEDGYF